MSKSYAGSASLGSTADNLPGNFKLGIGSANKFLATPAAPSASSSSISISDGLAPSSGVDRIVGLVAGDSTAAASFLADANARSTEPGLRAGVPRREDFSGVLATGSAPGREGGAIDRPA